MSIAVQRERLESADGAVERVLTHLPLPRTRRDLQELVGGSSLEGRGTPEQVRLAYGVISRGSVVRVNGFGARMLQLTDPSPEGKETYETLLASLRGQACSASEAPDGEELPVDTRQQVFALFGMLDGIPLEGEDEATPFNRLEYVEATELDVIPTTADELQLLLPRWLALLPEIDKTGRREKAIAIYEYLQSYFSGGEAQQQLPRDIQDAAKALCDFCHRREISFKLRAPTPQAEELQRDWRFRLSLWLAEKYPRVFGSVPRKRI